jgi:hypothetical protein
MMGEWMADKAMLLGIAMIVGPFVFVTIAPVFF